MKKVFLFITVIGVFYALTTVYGQSPSSLKSSVPVPVTKNSIAPQGTVDPAMVNQFASLLASITTITIDTSIFSNPAYKTLRDYPVVFGTDVVGRPNPFDPIGAETSTKTTEASAENAAPAPVTPFSVTTLPVKKITSTSAEFGALVNMPDSAAISLVFQYGTTESFGNMTPPLKIQQSGTRSGTIKGLLPGTTYYVKVVGVHADEQPVEGNVVSFTTTKGKTQKTTPAKTTTKTPIKTNQSNY